MCLVNLLTVNSEAGNEQDLVKVVEEAREYFPKESWHEILYFGNLTLYHDVKLIVEGQTMGAFLLKKILDRFEKIRSSDKLVSLLLGITSDPMVLMHYIFDGRSFRRALYVVHDFANRKVGIVSLFKVSEDSSSKVVAHGLGHNRGLRHHAKPIDLMYSELLRASALRVDGFCKTCLLELKAPKEKRGSVS